MVDGQAQWGAVADFFKKKPVSKQTNKKCSSSLKCPPIIKFCFWGGMIYLPRISVVYRWWFQPPNPSKRSLKAINSK
jgi:hypothetical protein